jgi:hypothetical protein
LKLPVPPHSSAIALLFAVLFVSRTLWASGSVEPVTVDYDVPAGCPDVVGFGEGVAARLGYDPFTQGAKRHLRARIHRVGTTLRGTVELVDERSRILGTKTLDASKCDDLVSAMTLAASMAIDPFHFLRPPTTESLSESAPPIQPVRAPAPTPTRLASERIPDAVARPAARMIPDAFVEGGVAGFGPVAGVAPAFGLGAGLRYRAFSFDVFGRYVAPATEAAGAGQVRTSTIGIALLPCARPGFFFVCANVFVGALQGAALGVDSPENATTFFSQAGIRLGGTIPVYRTRVEPFVDGLATLTPTDAAFRGVNVWSTRPLGFATGIRVAYPFL